MHKGLHLQYALSVVQSKRFTEKDSKIEHHRKVLPNLRATVDKILSNGAQKLMGL